MGDYNDGSYNKSIKEGIGAKLKKSEVKPFGIYNPFEQMAKDGHASLFYRDSGDIFDQIMVSETLFHFFYQININGKVVTVADFVFGMAQGITGIPSKFFDHEGLVVNSGFPVLISGIIALDQGFGNHNLVENIA